jgi:hypothetical protein
MKEEIVLAMQDEVPGQLVQHLDHALHDGHMGENGRREFTCQMARVFVIDRARELRQPVAAGAELLGVT